VAEDKPRGYILIEPDLRLVVSWPDCDTWVHCLSYLVKRIGEGVAIPSGVMFELIPAQYLGGPYPAIGLYTTMYVDTDENLWNLAWKIQEELDTLVAHLGRERLLELSANEAVCWKDVLQ
jgi:hypothetical protein